MKSNGSKFSKLIAGLIAGSAILSTVGVNTSAMEQNLGNANDASESIKYEIKRDVAMNVKYKLISEIIDEILDSQNDPAKRIIVMKFLGARQYLKDNLRDISSFLDLTRGPVSGRWLSKYTGRGLYDLVFHDQEYVLQCLQNNSSKNWYRL